MSPYDENWNLDDNHVLDKLAVEMQLNHPSTISVFTPAEARTSMCGGCGAKLSGESFDDLGRNVRDFACGHRYVIGQRTVSIERVSAPAA